MVGGSKGKSLTELESFLALLKYGGEALYISFCKYSALLPWGSIRINIAMRKCVDVVKLIKCANV